MQYNYDPTVTPVGTLMGFFAVVAVVATERVVGVSRLSGTESKR
jgi:putative spermidine/putrescine transport system permease protein